MYYFNVKDTPLLLKPVELTLQFYFYIQYSLFIFSQNNYTFNYIRIVNAKRELSCEALNQFINNEVKTSKSLCHPAFDAGSNKWSI
ncbi:MAG: hypothetical protein WC197_05120 [Candidatus Gastranaerophilaceae bacterium]